MRGNESNLNRLQLNEGSTSNKSFLIPSFVFKNSCLTPVHHCGIAFPDG